MDGVFTVCRSSWAWVHRHYGVDNEKSVRDYLQGRIDDYEFMRRDIALWRRALGREVTVEDVVRPLKDIKFTQGAVELVEGLKERGYRVGIISGGLDLLAERLLRVRRRTRCSFPSLRGTTPVRTPWWLWGTQW